MTRIFLDSNHGTEQEFMDLLPQSHEKLRISLEDFYRFTRSGCVSILLPISRNTERVQERSYVFSVVGTSRCDVRAVCSGATPSNAGFARIFVPPAGGDGAAHRPYHHAKTHTAGQQL